MENKIEFSDKDGKEVKWNYVKLDETVLSLQAYKLLCELFKESGVTHLSEFVIFLVYNYKYKDTDKARQILRNEGISNLSFEEEGSICNQRDLKEVIGKGKNDVTTSEIEY